MKRIIVAGAIALSFLIGPITAYSQYFLAGQRNATDYYVDIDPDTTLVGPNNHAENLPPAIFKIDIDGNGVNDFYLSSIGSWANGFGNSAITVKGYDPNNQIAFGYADTCRLPNSMHSLYNMARSFVVNDTINSNSGWNPALYLTYTDWMLMFYSCYHNSFINDTHGNYIGVRIIEPKDTIHGWIKVTNVNGLSFTVQEFGCSKNATGILDLTDMVRIFPTPAYGKVTIETPLPDFDLAVYNLYGTEILTRKHVHKTTQVDLGGKSSGIYVFKILKDQAVIVKKIIKL